jgi:hypothetical protein
MVGERNKAYRRLNIYDIRRDDADIKPGDVCVFNKYGKFNIFLESEDHLHFDGKMYMPKQRSMVDAIIE